MGVGGGGREGRGNQGTATFTFSSQKYEQFVREVYSCKPPNLSSPYGNSCFVIGLFYVTRSLLS